MRQKIILMLLFMCTSYSGIYAREKDGSSYYNAIPIEIRDHRFSFSDMRNTATVSGAYAPYYQQLSDDSYEWTDGKVVYYRFETTRTGDFIIHNWGSDLNCTNLFLVSPVDPSIRPEPMSFSYPVFTVEAFESGDFYDPVDLYAPEYARGMQGYIHAQDLPAGVYYIIAGGYKGGNMGVRDGNIRTTLVASLNYEMPPEPPLLPDYANVSTIQYQYDLSGNRIKTILK